MDHRLLGTSTLGCSGLEITRVGFGGWAIGGGGREAEWGPQQDRESIEALHRGVELGVNWIDTAAGYGYGRSEVLIGRALADLDVRQRPYVFTKCTLVDSSAHPSEPTSQREFLLREVEASLRRLRTDTIDLYQIHRPMPDQAIEDAWSVLAELKAQGVLKHIGVSNFDVAQIRRIESIAAVETLQPSYSVLDRSAEADLLPYAERSDIGVIVYSPMGSGLLAGTMTRARVAALSDSDWRKTDARFTEPLLSKHLAMSAQLRAVADRHGAHPGAVAVAWTLRNPAVTGAIAGFRRADQVDAIVMAANLGLTDHDIAELATEG